MDATFKLIAYRRTLESLMNVDAEVFDMAVHAMRRQAPENTNITAPRAVCFSVREGKETFHFSAGRRIVIAGRRSTGQRKGGRNEKRNEIRRSTHNTAKF